MQQFTFLLYFELGGPRGHRQYLGIDGRWYSTNDAFQVRYFSSLTEVKNFLLKLHEDNLSPLKKYEQYFVHQLPITLATSLGTSLQVEEKVDFAFSPAEK